MQADILGNSLTQCVAVEEYMPHQSHPFRIHNLAGMQSNARVARNILCVLPEPVVGIRGDSTVRVGKFRHRQPGQLFNVWGIEHALSLKVMNQCQRA